MTDSCSYYFAYGSNMNPARVQKRKMSYNLCEAGTLMNYALAFNKRSVKYPGTAAANVIPATGDKVEGVLYQLQNPEQIFMMDPYEGHPARYLRILLPIRTRSTEVAGWVYIANTDHVETGLKPARWYLQHLLAGRGYLTDTYAHRLEATPCLPNTESEPC